MRDHVCCCCLPNSGVSSDKEHSAGELGCSKLGRKSERKNLFSFCYLLYISAIAISTVGFRICIFMLHNSFIVTAYNLSVERKV